MMLPTLHTPKEAPHTAGKGRAGWGNAQEKQGTKDEQITEEDDHKGRKEKGKFSNKRD